MHALWSKCRGQLRLCDAPWHRRQREALEQHGQNDLCLYQREVAANTLALAGTKRNPGLAVPPFRDSAQEA